MLFGISEKTNFGKRSFQVVKFPNQNSAEFWLKKEQYDFRDRIILKNQKETREYLEEYMEANDATHLLDIASTMTLKKGELEEELSDIYISEQMGGEW